MRKENASFFPSIGQTFDSTPKLDPQLQETKRNETNENYHQINSNNELKRNVLIE